MAAEVFNSLLRVLGAEDLAYLVDASFPRTHRLRSLCRSVRLHSHISLVSHDLSASSLELRANRLDILHALFMTSELLSVSISVRCLNSLLGGSIHHFELLEHVRALRLRGDVEDLRISGFHTASCKWTLHMLDHLDNLIIREKSLVRIRNDHELVATYAFLA